MENIVAMLLKYSTRCNCKEFSTVPEFTVSTETGLLQQYDKCSVTLYCLDGGLLGKRGQLGKWNPVTVAGEQARPSDLHPRSIPFLIGQGWGCGWWKMSRFVLDVPKKQGTSLWRGLPNVEDLFLVVLVKLLGSQCRTVRPQSCFQ